MRHDIEGRDLHAALRGKGSRGEELRAVGDDALEDAGENVEEGSASSRIDLVLLADLLGYVAGYDDGDGVIRCRTVHKGDEGSDAKLCCLRSPDHAVELVDEPGDAAVVGNHLGNAAAEKGEEEGFVHAGKSVPDSLGKRYDREIPGRQPDAAGEEDADDKDEEDVRSHEGKEEDDDVGKDLHEVESARCVRNCCARRPKDEEDGNRCNGGRKGDEEVHLEFVLQCAALCLCRRDRRVRNHGKIVAEHRAAHAGRDDEGSGNAALLADAGCDRYDGCYRSHGCARGRSHEGGNEEDAGRQVLCRDHADAKIHRCVAAAHGSSHSGEGTRQDVDHEHGHDVVIGSALREDAELEHDRLASETEGREHGNEHRRHGRELIESHVHALHLEVDACTKVDGDEDEEGEQRLETANVGGFVFHSYLEKSRGSYLKNNS